MYSLADKHGIPALGKRALNAMFDRIEVWESQEDVWSIVAFMEATGMDTAELEKRLSDYFIDNIAFHKHEVRFDDMIKNHNDLALSILRGLANVATFCCSSNH